MGGGFYPEKLTRDFICPVAVFQSSVKLTKWLVEIQNVCFDFNYFFLTTSIKLFALTFEQKFQQYLPETQTKFFFC